MSPLVATTTPATTIVCSRAGVHGHGAGGGIAGGKGRRHQSAAAEAGVEFTVVGLPGIVRVADQAELVVGRGADNEDVAVVQGLGGGLVEAAAALEIRRLLAIAANLGGPVGVMVVRRPVRCATAATAIESLVQCAGRNAHAAGERAIGAGSSDGDRVLTGAIRVGMDDIRLI